MRRDTLCAHRFALEEERERGDKDGEGGDARERGQGSLPHGEATTSQRGQETGEKKRQVEALAIIRGAPELLVAPDGYARFSELEHVEVRFIQLHTGAWTVTASERPGGPSGT